MKELLERLDSLPVGIFKHLLIGSVFLPKCHSYGISGFQKRKYLTLETAEY